MRGIGIEGRRNLRGVECAQAAAGSGANVDEASTGAERGGHNVDGAGDLRQGAADGGGNGGVFVVDEADDFERGHAVEIGGRGVGLLRA